MYFAKEVLDSSSEMRRKWEDEVKKLVAKSADQKPRWSTVSDLEIKRLYTPEDIKDMDFARDIGYPGPVSLHPRQPADRLSGQILDLPDVLRAWEMPRQPTSAGTCS